MPIYWNYTKRQKLKEKRANLSRYPSYSRPEKQRKISYPEKSFKINAQSIHDKHFSKRSKSEEKDDQENVDENKVAELITRPKETWILDQQSEDFQLYLEDDLEDLNTRRNSNETFIQNDDSSCIYNLRNED